MATEADPKAIRSAKKGAVSLRLRNIKRYMAEDEMSKVMTKYDELKSAFQEFADSHDTLHSDLTDTQEIEQSDKYYLDMEDYYVHEMNTVREYIRSGAKSAQVEKASLAKASSTVTTIKLPPAPQPDVFTGKPESYPMWLASFNALIGKHEKLAFDEKMFYLKKYTSGEAQSAIEALFMCPSKESYEAALDILKTRFGNPTRVTADYRRRLEGWPIVADRDGKALRKYADYLTQVLAAQPSYPALKILDDEFENQKLVKKLPPKLAEEWVDEVVEQDTYPNFKQFRDFCDKRAEKWNHPILAQRQGASTTQRHGANSSDQKSGRYHQSKSSASSLNTQTSGKQGSQTKSQTSAKTRPSQQAKCSVCDGSHAAAECPTLFAKLLEDRVRHLRDKGLCFGCLGSGHVSKYCVGRHTCDVCKRRHPTLLHDYSKDLQNTSGTDIQSHSQATNFFLDGSNRGSATTMVLPVVVSHPSSDKEITVYALLDTQSNTHFVSRDIAEALGVEGHPTSLEVTTMSGKSRSSSELVQNLVVKGVDSGAQVLLSRCYTRDTIPGNRQSIPTSSTLERFPHLSDIDLPPYFEDAPIGLLIGYTCPEAIRPLDVVAGPGDDAFGWRTKLGWCVVGLTTAEPVEVDSVGLSHVVYGSIALRCECREVMLDQGHEGPHLLSHELEDPGVISAHDRKFIKIMKEQMKQGPDLHYQAPLPLKCEPHLPDNKSLALKRLNGLKSKFTKDSSYQKKYCTVIDDMLSSGFAEIVPQGNDPVGKTWFLPHHGVPKGEDQVRVVFDCSAQYKQCSLNELLLQGPDMMNDLLGILLRFRLKPVGVTCDIAKMFHQFRVAPEDRDLLRFLWWPGGCVDSEPQVYRMTVHLFGAVSSPGVAAYALKQIAADHGAKYAPEASQFVDKDFYVDDGCTAVDSDPEGLKLITETQGLVGEGGLRCHKVRSNSQELVAAVSVEDRAPLDMHKTLGIMWDVGSDELGIPLQVSSSKMSRRGMLSAMSSIYDPLGLVSPLILQARILLQQLCRQQFSWDDPLPPDIKSKYEKWCNELRNVEMIRTPRCVTPVGELERVELHHFADASTEAYAACSYLRCVDKDGNSQMTLMMGKCKVVPIKPELSVPRLELMAAVLAVHLASVLKRELSLDISGEFFWTDSTIVLGYIRNESARFKVFVANRIQKIHDGSKPEQWHHVPGIDNPADDGSRALFTDRWLHGPESLGQGQMERLDPMIELDPQDVEVKCLATELEEAPPEVHTYRSWFSTKKVWAWVLRFVGNCRGKKKQGELSISELQAAENHLLSMAQRSCFRQELTRLRQKQPVGRDSRLYKLDVFMDGEGLLRVGGRLKHADLSYELRHPVVLPQNHVISNLVIAHHHRAVHHQGRGITVSEIRNHGYWVIRLTRQVKSLIRSCVTCRRLRSRPCEQKMADLPPDRVTPSGPFQFSGCDLWGPYIIKNKRSELKRYGIIFTCLNSRAVHLDVVYTLSSDSFLNAFKRFIAVRGPVEVLRCDQGTNFIGARQELLKLGCELKLNPPSSSHRGGVWERMIGASRRVIESILVEHGSQLDDEGLHTVLAETMSVINSRPLNVQSLTDPQLTPLTPNHLLTMKSCVVTKPSQQFQSERTDLYAIKQWKRVQYLVDLFWSRWKKEILQCHQARPKWNIVRENLKVDDIVLLVDEQTHRSHWKLARVVTVEVSDDKLVRSVTVKLADGSTLSRPVQKLILIASN